MTSYNADLDFNLDTDVKIPGLVPDGTYHANVVSVAYDAEKACIIWKVALTENGGLCSDDETPVDGTTHEFKNWLPKAGDENERTTSGKQTKRQAKINMLGEFMAKMQLKEKTAGEILEAVENAEYVGLEIDVKLSTREWNGSVFNDIQKMYVAS